MNECVKLGESVLRGWAGFFPRKNSLYPGIGFRLVKPAPTHSWPCCWGFDVFRAKLVPDSSLQPPHQHFTTSGSYCWLIGASIPDQAFKMQMSLDSCKRHSLRIPCGEQQARSRGEAEAVTADRKLFPLQWCRGRGAGAGGGLLRARRLRTLTRTRPSVNLTAVRSDT